MGLGSIAIGPDGVICFYGFLARELIGIQLYRHNDNLISKVIAITSLFVAINVCALENYSVQSIIVLINSIPPVNLKFKKYAINNKLAYLRLPQNIGAR